MFTIVHGYKSTPYFSDETDDIRKKHLSYIWAYIMANVPNFMKFFFAIA
jgi:hypothetical protein